MLGARQNSHSLGTAKAGGGGAKRIVQFGGGGNVLQSAPLQKQTWRLRRWDWSGLHPFPQKKSQMTRRGQTGKTYHMCGVQTHFWGGFYGMFPSAGLWKLVPSREMSDLYTFGCSFTIQAKVELQMCNCAHTTDSNTSTGSCTLGSFVEGDIQITLNWQLQFL